MRTSDFRFPWQIADLWNGELRIQKNGDEAVRYREKKPSKLLLAVLIISPISLLAGVLIIADDPQPGAT